MELLCSFRLVLEGATGKEIPQSSQLELLAKFLENNFALSKLGSDGLFSFSSIWKFGSFKNPFAMVTFLSELYTRFRRFILAAAEALSLKISSHRNDHKDHPKLLKNSHKPCNVTGHLVLHLLESQWKLRPEYDQNFPIEGKPL